MFKLSVRMQAVYDHLLPGEPVWDFCCDHGYLGLSAYRSERFPEVHFVDQVPHIIEKLKIRFEQKHQKYEKHQRAYFWAQSGESLTREISGTVVIIGVGTHTITDILRGIHEKNSGLINRYILCTHNYEEKLEAFLNEFEPFKSAHKFTKFCNVSENGRVRKLLIFDKI
jgi:tRNA (adenine22-N1)-methyltransferase